MTVLLEESERTHELQTEYQIIDRSRSFSKGVEKDLVDRIWSRAWKKTVITNILTDIDKQTVSSQIVKSLRYSAMDNRMAGITDAFESTYRWMLEPANNPNRTALSDFPAWLGNDSSEPFWITGKPGSGKSTMMKFVLEHKVTEKCLARWTQGHKCINLVYYAWNPGTNLEKPSEGLLRSLLYQLLDHDPGLLPEICPRRWAYAQFSRGSYVRWPCWEIDELMECLDHLVAYSQKTSTRFCIFIDGLDEFTTPPLTLCALVKKLTGSQLIKVCVASRPWPQFKDAFIASPTVRMEDLTKDDIELYVARNAQNNVAMQQEIKALSPKGYEDLLKGVVEKAEGVFLWVGLVVKAILFAATEGAGIQGLHGILDNMPPELEDLYDAIFEKIPAAKHSDFAVMLSLFESVYIEGGQNGISFWLADETRGSFSKLDASVDLRNQGVILSNLKRRLSATTLGILECHELAAGGLVSFLHRTASEWASKERVRKDLRRLIPIGFDPYLSFLCANVLLAELLAEETESQIRSQNLSRRIPKIIDLASQTDAIHEKTTFEALDRFRNCCTLPPGAVNQEWPYLTLNNLTVAGLYELCCRHNKFLRYLQQELAKPESSHSSMSQPRFFWNLLTELAESRPTSSSEQLLESFLQQVPVALRRRPSFAMPGYRRIGSSYLQGWDKLERVIGRYCEMREVKAERAMHLAGVTSNLRKPKSSEEKRDQQCSKPTGRHSRGCCESMFGWWSS